MRVVAASARTGSLGCQDLAIAIATFCGDRRPLERTVAIEIGGKDLPAKISKDRARRRRGGLLIQRSQYAIDQASGLAMQPGQFGRGGNVSPRMLAAQRERKAGTVILWLGRKKRAKFILRKRNQDTGRPT